LSIISHVTKQPKIATCARKVMSLPSANTKDFWVPRSLLTNLDGPIKRWVPKYVCRRFETGGSLGRRVRCRRVPQSRWVGARPSAKGGKRWPETGVREVEIPRPSCSSRAQVRCACSRGLQASTRERERAASRERLSRPRPHAANPL
jgi:hypothetical protein